MQRLLSLTALGLALALGSAHAGEGRTPAAAAPPPAAPAAPNTAAAAAGTAPASNRPAYTKARPRGRAAAPPKIKICNVDASGKKGDERTASLSACLKTEPPNRAGQTVRTQQLTPAQ